jgi:hypothetical protein
MREEPDIALRIIEILCSKLRRTTEQIPGRAIAADRPGVTKRRGPARKIQQGLTGLVPLGGIWHTRLMLPWRSQTISRMPLPDRVRSGGMG